MTGEKTCNIVDILGIHESTVSRVWKKFCDSGSLENKVRSGRPKLTDRRSDRRLCRMVQGNRRRSLIDLTNEFNDVCHQVYLKELFKGDFISMVLENVLFGKLSQFLR